MDSSSEDDGAYPQKVEYDHYDTDYTIIYQEAPQEWNSFMREISKEKSCPSGPNLKRTPLLKILRYKLLEHKWEDAAMIMEGLAMQGAQNPMMGDLFWKVGNAVLYNHPHTSKEDNLVLQHKEATKTFFSKVDPTHVLFEYVMHLMSKHEFDEAREALKFFRNINRSQASEQTLASLEEWTPVMEGYLGMLDYISWKEMTLEMDSRTGFGDNEDHSVCISKAEEAISHFDITLKSPGIWDIFITKYVEIMEQLGRISEAEESLRANSSKNPGNPNAHKYWYQLLVKHPDIEENADKRVQALSSLHEVAPSDIYMLDLHNLRMDAAFAVKSEAERFITMAALALEILLDLLDYETWLNHGEAWQTLAKSLKRVKKTIKKKTFKDIVGTIWHEPMRNTWWPKYHFTKQRIDEAIEIGPDFVKAKNYVAKTLIGRQCEFCIYMKEISTSSKMRE